MALNYVQTNTLFLSGSGVIVGATSASLTSLTDIYGNTLSMADFGTKGYITFEPDTTNEEAATFTGITANANGTYTLTGLSTALAKSPYTETSGLVRSHSGGTKVVITDNAAYWNTFTNKNNNETITGTWTFNTSPSSLSATPASTAALGNVKLSSAPSTTIGNPTISITSPAVVTLASHGLIAGDSVQFTTTGALPTGLTVGVTYWVIAAGLGTNTFEVSTTVGGSAVNTSGSQSGTHTLLRTTPVAVGNDDTRVPTAAISAGLTNAPTTPSSINPFYTKTDVNGARLPTTQLLTSSGTFTVPTGITRLLVRLVGAGGGSGYNASGNGTGGGGGGGYSEGTLTVTPGANIGYTVGTGGASANGTGGTGGTTTFSTISATGGAGGVNGTPPSGGAGGTGSGGTLNIAGSPGGTPVLITGSTYTPSFGGASVFGGNLSPGNTAPTIYGAGIATGAGSSASNGVIIITY